MEDLNNEKERASDIEASSGEREHEAVHQEPTGENHAEPHPEEASVPAEEEPEAAPNAAEMPVADVASDTESKPEGDSPADKEPHSEASAQSQASAYQWKISQLGAQGAQQQTPYGHDIDVGTPGFTMQRGNADTQRSAGMQYGSINNQAPPKKKSRTPLVLLTLLVVAVLVAAVSITISTRQQLKDLEEYMESYGYNGGDSWSDTSEPEETTIERAETGAASPLTLERRSETDEALTMQELYARCADSVVYIFTSYTGSSYSGSEGSGVVLSEDGYIVTNAHVISGGSSASVILSNGNRYNAKLVGMDEENDLAVLKVDATGLTPAVFANSDDVVVGETVAAIGNPMGYELRGTITSGIVSAVNRSVWVDSGYRNFIQTSAPISSGNSGGALFDMYGRVIGITTLKYVVDLEYESFAENLGFAIPSTTVRSIISDLIAYGQVQEKRTIGISVSTLSDSSAQELGLSHGLYVELVEEDSAAAEAGLQVGDILLEAQQQALYNSNDLLNVRDSLEADESFDLTVYRDGTTFSVQITPK